MEGEHWTGLALVQPTRKREWQLRQGDHVVAELQLPALKRGGKARVGDRELELRVSGLLRPEHVLVDASTGEEVARVRRKQVALASEQAEWKSLGRGRGYGLVGADGEPWLRAKVSSGTFRSTGQVEVAPGRDVAVPALLAAYLLIRKADETASAAGAAVVAS